MGKTKDKISVTAFSKLSFKDAVDMTMLVWVEGSIDEMDKVKNSFFRGLGLLVDGDMSQRALDTEIAINQNAAAKLQKELEAMRDRIEEQEDGNS